MQAYPQEYVEHNLPLVFLSGLGERQDHTGVAPSKRENGTRIVTGSAECSGVRARQLLDQLLNLDGSKQPWNAQALPGPSSTLKWRMRTIGRVGMQQPVGLDRSSLADSCRHSRSQHGKLHHCPIRQIWKDSRPVHSAVLSCTRRYRHSLQVRLSTPMACSRSYGSPSISGKSLLC